MDTANPLEQQHASSSSSSQQFVDVKMSLLTDEDWKALKSKSEDVLVGFLVCKFIKFFADDYKDLLNNALFPKIDTKTTSKIFEIPLQTLLKAQVLYHKVKAVKTLTNRNIPLIDQDFYGLACLFIAQKLDDLILFSIENCMKLYRAIFQEIQEGEERKLKRPLEMRHLISIQCLSSENAKTLKRNNLAKIITSLKNEIVMQDQERFYQVENDILVTLGFDLAVETSLEYIDAFLKTFREEVGKMQQQNIEKANEVANILNSIEGSKTDIYNSNMCLYYTPVQLALATIRHYSSLQRKEKVMFPLYQGQQWWRFFCVQFNADIQNEAEIELPKNEFKEFIKKLTRR